MSPAFKSLGPSPTRNLRKHIRLSHCSQQFQHGYRRNHHPPTDANGLEVTNGHPQENRAHNHLCSWLHVRLSIPISVFGGANLVIYSVCVVTIIRLVFSTQVKLDDYTYSVARVGVVTLLEPLLGIIVACLPIFPPAIKKIIDYMKSTHPETHNVLSSSMARLRLKRSKSSSFQSLEDSSPLRDLEAKGTQNHITGPSGKPGYRFESYGKPAESTVLPQSSIMVEQNLEVRSDEARYWEGKAEV